MPTPKRMELRRQHLGASDLGALFGLDKYRNRFDLYLEKTGKLEPEKENDNDNDPRAAGRILESAVLRFAENRLGQITRNQYRSVKDRGIPLGANCDALLNATGQPIEAKTSGLYGWTTDVFGDENTDQVPDRIILQAQGQMLCTDADLCYISAFIAFRGFVMFQIPRDAEIIDAISTEAVSFWENHILADIPPDNSLPHASSIKRIRREPESVVEIDQNLVNAWLIAKSDLKQMEAEKDAAEVAMLTALGQAEGGMTESGLLTYLAQSRATVDGKTLKIDHPNIYDQYVKVSTFRVPRFKVTKK